MNQTLPFFPLNTVVFPGDPLNLHIFEPRYRQMMQDCEAKGQNFGIPAHIDDHIQEIGMEIEVVEVVERYDDGRMDIKTRGVRPFRITTFENPWQDRLYAGGTVEWLPFDDNASITSKVMLLRQVAELYDLIRLELTLSPEDSFISFKVGHKVGLSLRQEYGLLTIPSEQKRIEYLIDHLARNIPVVRDMERTKERVRMNGHFRNFDPLDF